MTSVWISKTIFGSAIFLILLASLLSYYIPLGISRPVKEPSQVMDQVRYQDILEYEIQVPEALMDFQIPKITLQPLVERERFHCRISLSFAFFA